MCWVTAAFGFNKTQADKCAVGWTQPASSMPVIRKIAEPAVTRRTHLLPAHGQAPSLRCHIVQASVGRIGRESLEVEGGPIPLL